MATEPNRLKESRKKKGMTQQVLSDIAHVSVATLRRWEKDSHEKQNTLAIMASATGVTLAWLLGGDEPPPVDVIPALVLTPWESDFIQRYRTATQNTQRMMRECIQDALQIAKASTSTPMAERDPNLD